MSNSINVTCNPVNIEGIKPGTINLAYIPSAWSQTNVTAMTTCCGAEEAHEVGCFTWCELEDPDRSKADWEDCLTKEGRRVSGNSSYVSPTLLFIFDDDDDGNAATAQLGSFGTKGALLVALGVLSWVLI